MSNVKKYKTFLLSKKKWHVGLPENIAKVKKDEEEFLLKQEEDKRRNIFKASEQRMEILKKRNDEEENSDLPVITEFSGRPEKSIVNSSNSNSSSSKIQIQQETFKNLQNVPWYCKLESDDGKKVVAREMRVSYHGVLLNSKQQIIPIDENSKSNSVQFSAHPSVNTKILSSSPSSLSGAIIDGSQYLSSMLNDNSGPETSLTRRKEDKKEKNGIEEKERELKEVFRKKNGGTENVLLQRKKEDEDCLDQNVSLPPDFQKHHKKRKGDESSDSESDSSSSSSSSSDDIDKKKKRKRKERKEKKKRKREKEQKRNKKKRKKEE